MEYVQVRLVLLASAMNESMWAGHLWRDDDGAFGEGILRKTFLQAFFLRKKALRSIRFDLLSDQ